MKTNIIIFSVMVTVLLVNNIALGQSITKDDIKRQLSQGNISCKGNISLYDDLLLPVAFDGHENNNVDFSVESLNGIIGEELDYETAGNETRASSESFEYKLNLSKNSLHVVNVMKRFSEASLSSGIATKEEIKAIALQYMDSLGFDNLQEDSLIVNVRKLMKHTKAVGGPEHEYAPTPVAYKVNVNGQINEKRIEEQRLIFSFYLDGTIHKIMGAWPKIQEKSTYLTLSQSEDELADFIYGHIKNHALAGAEGSLTITSKIGIKDGELKKKVRISGKVLQEGKEDVLLSEILDIWL